MNKNILEAAAIVDSANKATAAEQPRILQVPVGWAGYHNIQGYPCILRIDHIIGINGAIGNVEVPEDEDNPNGPTKKIQVECTQILMVNSSANIIVAEHVDQAMAIWVSAMKVLNSKMTSPGIALPGGMSL